MVPIVFEFGGTTISFDHESVDRSALYGKVETIVTDQNGDKCRNALLDWDETEIFSGETETFLEDGSGRYIDKSDTHFVNEAGNTVEEAESSFAAPITEIKVVTDADYLEYNIKGAYQLSTDQLSCDLVAQMRRGVIFSFLYSYRRSFDPDTGFLLCGSDGNLFMTYGKRAQYEFTGPGSYAVPDDYDDDDDEIDFESM